MLEKAGGTCLALHTLVEQQEMTGPPGSFLFTGMSTSSESKGLFREDECWALGNGAGWPQSLSLPVPRAQLCGPALQGLGTFQLLDSGCFLPHHRMHRLALRHPSGCDSPVGAWLREASTDPLPKPSCLPIDPHTAPWNRVFASTY